MNQFTKIKVNPMNGLCINQNGRRNGQFPHQLLWASFMPMIIMIQWNELNFFSVRACVSSSREFTWGYGYGCMQ